MKKTLADTGLMILFTLFHEGIVIMSLMIAGYIEPTGPTWALICDIVIFAVSIAVMTWAKVKRLVKHESK